MALSTVKPAQIARNHAKISIPVIALLQGRLQQSSILVKALGDAASGAERHGHQCRDGFSRINFVVYR
jgi:hypothetical protein